MKLRVMSRIPLVTAFNLIARVRKKSHLGRLQVFDVWLASKTMDESVGH